MGYPIAFFLVGFHIYFAPLRRIWALRNIGKQCVAGALESLTPSCKGRAVVLWQPINAGFDAQKLWDRTCKIHIYIF